MRALLKVWLILFLTHLLARTVISLRGFYHVDLRFEVFAQIVVVPVVQALAVCGIVQIISLRAVITPLRAIVGSRTALTLLGVDAVVLALSLLPLDLSWLDLNRTGSVSDYYCGLKGLVAAFIVFLVAKDRHWRGADRWWLLISGAWLAAYAADYIVGWLEPVPELLFVRWPLLFRWAFTFGPLFVLSVLLLLKLEALLRCDFEASAGLVGWALGFACAGAIITTLSIYNRPLLLEPWKTLVKSIGFLVMSSVLLSAVFLWDQAKKE